MITTSRSNQTSITSIIERIDILLVTSELIDNSAGSNVPDSDDLVFSTSGQVFAIRAKADATNVKITVILAGSVLKSYNSLTSYNIVNLCKTIATCCDITTIKTEADATDYTAMGKGVYKLNLEIATNLRIVNDEPVISFLLVLWWKSLHIQIAKSIANSTNWQMIANLTWRR